MDVSLFILNCLLHLFFPYLSWSCLCSSYLHHLLFLSHPLTFLLVACFFYVYVSSRMFGIAVFFSLPCFSILGMHRFSAWTMFVYPRNMFLCTSTSTLSTWCWRSCYCLCWLCQRQMCTWNMQIFPSTRPSCWTIESSESAIRCCGCSRSIRSCSIAILTIHFSVISTILIE